jgi:hypothetical protein
MHKIVLNSCYGGFSLSQAGALRFQELSGEVLDFISGEDLADPSDILWLTGEIPRHHPALVQVVEELGEAANGEHASLGIEEIPGNRYYITEYDGVEELHYPESEGWIVIE